jgi:hypothetical protein
VQGPTGMAALQRIGERLQNLQANHRNLSHSLSVGRDEGMRARALGYALH